MGFRIGSKDVFPGAVSLPTDASRGAALFSNGSETYWAYPGEANTVVGGGFQYRSLITHGYVAGGYKGSNPWRSVNKTWHSTDTTYYLGEQLDRAASYVGGHWSDYNGYVMGTNNSFNTASVHTSSYNLHTGTMRQRGDGSFGSTGIGTEGYGTTTDNPAGAGFTYGSAVAEGTANPGVGGWNMSTAKTNHGAAPNQIGQEGYTMGGGNNSTERMHYPTEISYTTTAAPGSWAHTSVAGGENRIWVSFAGNRYSFTFASQAYAAWSTTAAPDGICKPLMTKWGFHYVGSGNNSTTPLLKFSDSNGASLSTTLVKPRGVGEENMEMGQDWGYLIGAFDTQQNNLTVKFTHATDTITTMGASTRPKGHYGMSSGATSSAAGSITAGYFV